MDENLTYVVSDVNADYASILWPNTLFNVVCLLIGLLGNGYVMYINKFLLTDKSDARYFIPYLAIADAFASSLTCIGFIHRNFNLIFPWNHGPCKAFFYGSVLVVFTSAFLLLAIAVQRYTKIITPFGRQFTLFWRRTALVVIVIASLFCSIPVTFFGGIQEINGYYKGVNMTVAICWVRDSESPTLQHGYFGFIAIILTTISSINFVATLVLYAPIAVVIYRRQRTTKLSSKIGRSPGNKTAETSEIELEQIDPSKSHTLKEYSKPASKSHEKRNITEETTPDETDKIKVTSPSTNFNAMFITIFVVYALSYIPTGVILLFVSDKNPATLIDLPHWQLQTYSILAQAYVLNNVANPFIYCYFDMQFRKYVVQHCKVFCFCCR